MDEQNDFDMKLLDEVIKENEQLKKELKKAKNEQLNNEDVINKIRKLVDADFVSTYIDVMHYGNRDSAIDIIASISAIIKIREGGE